MQPLHTAPVGDPDGAFEAALERAGGLSRRSVLKRAGVAAGGVGLVFGGFAPQAGAKSVATDLKVLEFGIVLEHLGIAFYREALQDADLSGETRAYAKQALKDEKAHLTFIAKTVRSLGGRPAAAPRFDFGRATQDQGAFQKAAREIETMCVEVLNGAGPLVGKPVLAGAGMLVSVEARQVAWISTIMDTSPAPSAFESITTPAKATKRLKRAGYLPKSF